MDKKLAHKLPMLLLRKLALLQSFSTAVVQDSPDIDDVIARAKAKSWAPTTQRDWRPDSFLPAMRCDFVVASDDWLFLKLVHFLSI
jgi:hypothetical protein